MIIIIIIILQIKSKVYKYINNINIKTINTNTLFKFDLIFNQLFASISAYLDLIFDIYLFTF
jgi:hypothetical protein